MSLAPRAVAVEPSPVDCLTTPVFFFPNDTPKLLAKFASGPPDVDCGRDALVGDDSGDERSRPCTDPDVVLRLANTSFDTPSPGDLSGLGVTFAHATNSSRL